MSILENCKAGIQSFQDEINSELLALTSELRAFSEGAALLTEYTSDDTQLRTAEEIDFGTLKCIVALQKAE